MPIIIDVLNNKGGVGKTTTSFNLAVALALMGRRVLAIDFDSQRHLSTCLSHHPNLDIATLIQRKEHLTSRDLSPTKIPNLYLIPNNKDTTSTLFDSFNPVDRPMVLKDILSEELPLDYVIIDNGPTLDIQTIVTMAASNYLLIPIEFDAFALDGLGNIFESLGSIKRRVNPTIEVLGILPVNVDERFNRTALLRQALKTNMGKYLLETTIRTNTRFADSQLENRSIFEYEMEKVRNSEDRKGSIDYANLAQEINKKVSLNKLKI